MDIVRNRLHTFFRSRWSDCWKWAASRISLFSPPKKVEYATTPYLQHNMDIPLQLFSNEEAVEPQRFFAEAKEKRYHERRGHFQSQTNLWFSFLLGSREEKKWTDMELSIISIRNWSPLNSEEIWRKMLYSHQRFLSAGVRFIRLGSVSYYEKQSFLANLEVVLVSTRTRILRHHQKRFDYQQGARRTKGRQPFIDPF